MTEPNTLDEQIENTLLESIVAIGVREEGTIKDLDTLIIDRQKAVDTLKALFTEHSKEVDRLARINQLKQDMFFLEDALDVAQTPTRTVARVASALEILKKNLAQLFKRNKGEKDV